MARHFEFPTEALLPYVFGAVHVLFILLFAWIATRLSRRLIRAIETYSLRMMVRKNDVPEFEIRKRVETISTVSSRTLGGLIWSVAIIMVLNELKFDVRPLIAGAGILGVALGFGAQNLVKDILGGFFLLIENQIRINDVAVINDQAGLVEEINLRTTVLRGEDGAVHIFPNGSINKLSNLTRDFSYAVLNVKVGYGEDTTRVAETIAQIVAELRASEPFDKFILADLDMMGVDALAADGVVIKFRLRTAPMKQAAVARELNARIKRRFAEAGIALAYPSRTTVEFTPDTAAALRGPNA